MLASGLVELLRRDRRTTGYFKLFETDQNNGGFVRELTGLQTAPVAALPPGSSNSSLPATGEQLSSFMSDAKAAGDDRDLLLVDGPSSINEGKSMGTDSGKLAKELDLRLFSSHRSTVSSSTTCSRPASRSATDCSAS